MMRAILSRLRGLCLLLLAFGPPAVVVGGIAVAVALTASIVSATRDRVEAVSDMVSGQIAPQLQALRGAYDGLATEAERVDVELTHTLATLSELQDLQLQPGQLGSSGPQHLQVPPQDVWIGPPVVGIKVDGGRLLDQNLPAIQIPDRPVAIPVAPLRAAFAPLGQDGPVGQAIQAAQGELRKTVGAVKELGAPISDVVATAEGWFAPVRDMVGRIVLAGELVVLALAALVLAYIVTGVWLAVRRPAEAAAAYRTGGEIGYLLYVHRTLVLDGAAGLAGRNPAARRTPDPGDLAALVTALQAEVGELRAELKRSRQDVAPLVAA